MIWVILSIAVGLLSAIVPVVLIRWYEGEVEKDERARRGE